MNSRAASAVSDWQSVVFLIAQRIPSIANKSTQARQDGESRVFERDIMEEYRDQNWHSLTA